jgi:hypothetical protein
MSKYEIVLANGRVIDPETYVDDKMYVGIKGESIARCRKRRSRARKSSTSRA